MGSPYRREMPQRSSAGPTLIGGSAPTSWMLTGTLSQLVPTKISPGLTAKLSCTSWSVHSTPPLANSSLRQNWPNLRTSSVGRVENATGSEWQDACFR